MKKQLKNKKVLIALVSVCIVLAAALSVFIYYKTGLKAVSSRETPTSFQVQPGETSEAVLDKLQTQELIRNKTVAKLYMKFHGLSDIKAGNFKLDARWDTPKILETLNDSKQANADDIKITFKEGMWAKDVAALIEKQTGVKAGELLTLWNDDAYLNTLLKKYSFLSKDILNAQYKVKLEGYLYPETYSFHKDATAKQITETFLDQFQKAIAPYEADIKKSGMSMQEAITFASIVQYEASTKEDMEMIVGVFQNRLKQGMTLDSSVTVCYALYDDMTSGEDCEVNTHIDSPYNTYKNAGLPIGPILNPGAMAIQAVLHPKANDYLYFVADIYGDGKVYYARTLDEQEANIDKYNLRK